MNGAAIPMPGVSLPPNSNAVANKVAGVNSLRISVVLDRLATCLSSPNPTEVTYFYNLCISLSRGIDYAIAINQKPTEVNMLPQICKLVCQRRMDSSLQAAMMVLMVTMKNACKAHWFSAEESRELLALADEVCRIFNTPAGFSSEQTNIMPIVSQIMSRYYPQIKLGHILACIDIKPGFETCAVGFPILKSMKSSSGGNIRLLVAMKDNIDTSACIINPQKVSFLLNGKGVVWRMVGYMEIGPQLPTDATSMLRYGTNLLQAIGHFEAHCIVLVAFMSDVPSSFLPVPEDYDQPASGTVESDAEVIEGASRISLNCPISFSRINKPAKGKLCKHLQCFDLSNYVEMNSRHPSWRCPHCNQPVCYPDLRIDKKMSKILEEVAEGVASVILNSDGSWEAVSGSDEKKDESPNKPPEDLQGGSEQQAVSGLANEPCNVYDLTEGDDEMVIIDVDMPEDMKPTVQTDLLSSSTYMSHFPQSAMGDPSEINRNSATQVHGGSAPMLGHFTSSPVLTDSVPPTARREQQAFQGNNQQSGPLTSIPSTNALQQQQAQWVGGEYPGLALSGNVLRVPTAVQARPLHMPVSNSMTSTRPVINDTPAINNLSGNTSSIPSRTPLPPVPSISVNTAHRNSVQQSHILTSQSAQHSPAQIRGLSAPAQAPNNGFGATSGPQAANQQRLPTQMPPQMIRGLSAPAQAPSNGFGATSGPQAANQQRPPTQMPTQMVSTPPHLRARTQGPPGGALSGGMHQSPLSGQPYRPTPAALAAQQAALRTRQLPTTRIQMQTSRPLSASVPPRSVDGTSHATGQVRMVQTVSRTQDLVGAQSEQDWRPTGRMRGSLAGRAYSDALNEFIIRPTQQTTPAPTPTPAPAPPGQLPNQNEFR